MPGICGNKSTTSEFIFNAGQVGEGHDGVQGTWGCDLGGTQVSATIGAEL